MTDQTTEQSTLPLGGGNPSAPAPAAPVPASPSTPPAGSPPAPASADKPAFLADDYWDGEKKAPKLEAMAGKLKELTEARTADEQRKASLPKAAGEYKVELPGDFKMPEGAQLDLENPMWGKFADYAHKLGLPQDAFSEGAALITEMQLAGQAAFQKSVADHVAAEEAKLGDNAKAIMESNHRFIDANASAEDAKEIKASITNAAMARWQAKQIQMLQSAGITAFNGNGRDQGPRAGEITGYEKMSWEEKFRNRQKPATAA